MAIKIRVLFLAFSTKTSQYRNFLSIFACSGFSAGAGFFIIGENAFLMRFVLWGFVLLYSEEDFYGVVGYADAGTLIEDCSVSGSFYTNSEFAGIAYEAKGGATIRSCSVSGNLYADSTSYGICYEFGEDGEEDEQNVMADCRVALSAWVDSSFYGLTEETNGDSTTTDCHVSGTFYIDSEFCGLMEYLYGGGTVQDCSVSGKVYADTMLGGMDEIHGAENSDRAAKITCVQVNLTAYAFTLVAVENLMQWNVNTLLLELQKILQFNTMK